MVALHAAEWKSRYQSPLPTYCNWGDCEASLQGQDDWGGRKAVLCSELNGAGALHSYRASAEDRVIQPNEILQHTSSQSAGVDFQARSKRITTLVLRYEASKYEQELQKKVEKNKKKNTERVKIKRKHGTWSNHFVFRERWLMCHSSFQLVKGLKEEWIIWVWAYTYP